MSQKKGHFKLQYDRFRHFWASACHTSSKKFHIFKGFQMCVIIFPIWFLFNCNSGLQPTQPQLTFLFLIRTFLAPRQSHWLQFFPCHQANLRFPLRACVAGCSKHLHELLVSKTKPQHCNYNMTINRANQQLTQQHLSSTQSETAALCDIYEKQEEGKNKNIPRKAFIELSAGFYIGE